GRSAVCRRGRGRQRRRRLKEHAQASPRTQPLDRGGRFRGPRQERPAGVPAHRIEGGGSSGPRRRPARVAGLRDRDRDGDRREQGARRAGDGGPRLLLGRALRPLQRLPGADPWGAGDRPRTGGPLGRRMVDPRVRPVVRLRRQGGGDQRVRTGRRCRPIRPGGRAM
ncbi:MAG: Ribose 5-phosphate isomerase B, partial [uncultured Thermomicrobiales bacterium]